MKYTLGLDFGTLSARCVLACTADGTVVATKTYDYPHAVLETVLPDGTPLDIDAAYQVPDDYLEAMIHTIRSVMAESGVSPDDVIGIGLDFTSCTLIPIKKDGTPLCHFPQFRSNPHAYAKLWKHHAAQPEANTINAAAEGEDWVQRFGGKVSCESQLPKVLETIHKAPDVFDTADYIMEGGDWIVLMLTGCATKNICCAGFKCAFDTRTGYPSEETLFNIDPKLATYVREKLDYPLVFIGDKAGELTESMASTLGLRPGIAVASAIIDAHAPMPAVKANKEGQVLASIGTSSGFILIGNEERAVPGISAIVKDGIYRDKFAYEAGQVCVGDHFAWAVRTCCPASYDAICKERGIGAHALLNELAAALKPGESGLLALDWWNGNRCVLEDANLSGMILGMTLQTKPEEIYRALLEAHTFGMRVIMDAFRTSGVPVDEIIAGGGIPAKSPLLMQIYADVLNLPIRVAGSTLAGALGSAIFAASAAGAAAGGYDDIYEASDAMGIDSDTEYTPIPENVAVYEKLYQEFVLLHDYFGRGENNVMKRIKAIKQDIRR